MDFNAVLQENQVMERPFDLELVKAAFGPFKAKLEQIKASADSLTVTDDHAAQEATTIAGEVKRLSKAIENKRKEIIEEPNQFVRSVNGMAKMFTTPAGEIEHILKKKIGLYQAQKELERRKQEELMRQAQEELHKKQIAEAKASHVEAPPPPPPIPLKVETVTRSETGASAHIRKVWKGEVSDENLVPREFCSPDQKLINEAVRLGVREIPGVKIWEDIQTILRT